MAVNTPPPRAPRARASREHGRPALAEMHSEPTSPKKRNIGNKLPKLRLRMVVFLR